MVAYQRFVAYVYEYRKGKKENNCGFLRMETRDENVTVEIHLKCPGLPADERCDVYGFVRTAGLMKGILLGSAWSEAGKLDCMIESEKIENCLWKEVFPKFGGMVIRTEHLAFFGTEWDDQPIKTENFEAEKVKNILGDSMTDNRVSESNSMHMQEIAESISVNQEIVNSESQQINIEQQQTGQQQTEQQQTEQQQIEQQQIEQSEPEQSAQRMQKPHKINPAFCPFYDEEISECRKVHPNEFFQSFPRTCNLRSNRFLEHGYYNFGHLLVGKRADGKWILGVPGGYDQQERFMANMFGFPYFKESREIQLPGGRGGYWYRLINAANFHQ